MSTLAFRKGLGAISSATSSYLIQNVKNPLLIEVGGRASGTPAAVPGTVGGLAQFPAIAALVEQEERMYHSPEKSTVLSDARAYRPRTVHNDGRQLKDPTAFASKHIVGPLPSPISPSPSPLHPLLNRRLIYVCTAPVPAVPVCFTSPSFERV